jgi:hypothetical protein
MRPAQLVHYLANPADLWRWLRQRLTLREPPVTRCRGCGRTGKIFLELSELRDGWVIETWRCRHCGTPRKAVFPDE